MDTSASALIVACPTCGTALPGWTGPGPACPNCGLPAAGHAGYVVARIDATLVEFRADRDRLLDTLRWLAPHHRPTTRTDVAVGHDNTAVPGVPRTDPDLLEHGFEPLPVTGPGSGPPRGSFPGPLAPPAQRQRRPRRLSPQQLLLGTGAVLLVSAAIAFVAIAWGQLGLAVQATALAVVTGSVCAASVAAARRGLRTTAEALAMAGIALVVVDLVAARIKGLAGLDELPGRAHAALTLGVIIVLGLALHRAARTTPTWPIGALIAAQPLAFLALPERTPVLLVATALLVTAFNVTVVGNIRAGTAGTAGAAIGFAGLWWLAGNALAAVTAWTGSIVESGLSTLLVAVSAGLAVGALAYLRLDRFASLAPIIDLTAVAVGIIAVSGTLQQTGIVGVWLTGLLGLAVLTGAVLLRAMVGSPSRRWEIPALLAGTLLGLISVGQLTRDQNWTLLAGLTALAAVCCVGISIADRGIRGPAAVSAALLPGVAVLLLVADGLAAQQGGWILAVLGASVLGVASARVHQMEERPLAVAAGLIGLTAVSLTATSLAWGQLALQLSVTGAAALAYGQATRYRLATLIGLAELVLASWVGAAGLSVTTPEVYTLPAAVGLLLAAGGRLVTGSSWSAWGAPLLVSLVPSTLVTLGNPDALRLVLLVAAATACAVAGTLTHRQAPFVIGLGVLTALAVTQLGPYATLLPRWLSLGAAGVLLLVLGASYERRLTQAREAVAWVSALR